MMRYWLVVGELVGWTAHTAVVAVKKKSDDDDEIDTLVRSLRWNFPLDQTTSRT